MNIKTGEGLYDFPCLSILSLKGVRTYEARIFLSNREPFWRWWRLTDSSVVSLVFTNRGGACKRMGA